MSDLLKKAQQWVESCKENVNHEYKPRFHLSVPAGWLNDPNGFGFFGGKCHLFYQHYPYDSVWGPMHWGHWTSDNLTDWQTEPVAIAPDSAFDSAGCFSGTGMEENGRYYLMYTGVTEENGSTVQQQCLAWSDDGIHVEKAAENPVIGVKLAPEGLCPSDFRDPKLEKIGDTYRVIAAARVDDSGKLLSFSSSDLKNWTYSGIYAEGLGKMPECPDSFELDGHRVMVCSVIGSKDESLVLPQPVVYAIGFEQDGKFHAQTPLRDIDRGLDFYAPQSCLAPDGRRLLIGWAHSWDCVTAAHKLGHGWAGTMTLLRECRIENDRLFQRPIKEMQTLRKNRAVQSGLEISEKTPLSQCCGACREIIMSIDMRDSGRFELCLMETGDERVVLCYDKQDGRLTIDRSASGYSLAKDETVNARTCTSAELALQDQMLFLHIFVDVSIIEVYANHGEKVMTCQAFPRFKSYGVSASASGKAAITHLETYELA